jgi:tetratricopeptide (TPR) repeat protein
MSKEHGKKPKDGAPNHELHISQEQLKEVMNEAVHHQAHAPVRDEVSREALDEIAAQTGISKEMLEQAQASINARHRRKALITKVAGGAAAALVLLSAPVWFGHLFPAKAIDPVTAALQSEALRQEALRLRYEENYSDAVTTAERAVQMLPNSTLALNEMGLCYEYAGKVAQAQQAYQKAIASPTTGKDVCYPEYNFASMLAKTTLKSDAEKHFRAAIAAWPDFAPAHNALGKLLESVGRPADALIEYGATVTADATYRANTRNKQALAARLKHAGNLIDQANKLVASGKTSDGLILARKAVNQFGRNRMAQREMGLDYDGDPKMTHKLADGFYEEAEKLHQEGHKHHDNHDFSEAIDHCMAAVEVNPDDFPASFLLAMLYEDLGRHADAVDAYQLAIEMGGPVKDQTRAWSFLGDTYQKLAQPTDAEDAYQQAIKTGPSEYYSYDRLSAMLKTAGRSAEAQKVLLAGVNRIPGESHLKSDLASISNR